MVVTNPPYMGSSGMGATLSKYVKDNYPDSKSDLFAVFIEKCSVLAKDYGYMAMITQHAWMFLSSYEKLRIKLRQRDTINMAHLGVRAFAEIGGEVVQSTAFVMWNCHISDYKGSYVRLVDIGDADSKESEFLSGNHRYAASTDNFAKILGSPVAYWANNSLFKCFINFMNIGDYFHVRNGITTGDNSLFLRLWYEISPNAEKWYALNKGGAFRKWSGNRDYVIDWKNNGHRIKNFTDSNGRLRSTLRGIDFNFTAGITMSRVTSGEASFRKMYGDSISESATNALYPMNKSETNISYAMGMLNSKPIAFMLNLMNPTLNIVPEDIRGLPISLQHSELVIEIVDTNIVMSRSDWDSFETSWDFRRHPLV